MDDEWKGWDVVETIESIAPPMFLVEWETADEYEQQTKARVADHWNQFRAILTNGNSGPSEVQGGGYAALCRLRERLDSRHEKVQERLEDWEFESSLRKLIISGFKVKVRELALEKATDEENADPSEEEFEAAWEHVLDRPMGEEWPPDELETGRVLEEQGWQVSLLLVYDASRESPPTPTLSDLTIRYIPEDHALKREGIDPDSVSRRDTRSFDGDTTWEDALNRLGKRFKMYERQREKYDRTHKVIEFRRRILKNVLHQFEAYGSVEKMTEERAQEITEESRPGRRSTLNDPETYPDVTLRAVLEWTDDDANRAKPFRSETQLSLCGFVSERLEEKVGYQVPQDTIKTRLQSLMSELGVELPHSHTNTRSYFEAREEITEAMQKHGLSV